MYKLVVLCSVLAVAASSAIAPLGLGVAGLGWAGAGWAGNGWAGHGWAGNGWAGHGWAGPLGAPLAAPVVAAGHVAAAPVLGAYNYRGPLSLAPGQPANILAADGRPLDTLSVNLDRAAHYTARAVDGHGAHLLKKRSAPLLAPAAAWSHTARIDVPAARLLAPAAVGVAPYGLGWRAPIAPLGLGLGAVGPWGHAAPWGRAAPLGHYW